MLGQTFTEQNALKIIDLQLSELRMAMAADNDLIKEKLEVFENSLLDKDWLAGEEERSIISSSSWTQHLR